MSFRYQTSSSSLNIDRNEDADADSQAVAICRLLLSYQTLYKPTDPGDVKEL